jgi:hypothetical protein
MLENPPKRNWAYGLAWPETRCKQTGAWYDAIMHLIGLTKENYYKVGHAAILLVNEDGQVYYADFGRYHTPIGMGRVRSAHTDHDLTLHTKALFKSDGSIENIDEILSEIANNTSTHGDGPLVAAEVPVNFDKCMARVTALQQKTFIPYGPFVRPGTNCARFVADVLLSGAPSLWTALTIRLASLPSPLPGFLMKTIGPFKIIHKDFQQEHNYANSSAQ